MFDMELWENDALIARGFKIYRRTTLRRADTEKEIDHDDVFGCHFSGRVRSHADTPVSLSICNGLVSKNHSGKLNYLPGQFISFSTQSQLLTTLKKKALENTVGKGEIAGKEHFLLFPQCFLFYQREKLSF